MRFYGYGFNGKEKDENGELGSQTHYDYGFRIYNPGIGKFLSVDPLTASYPWYTPYQFAGNSPIEFIDLDGLENIHYQLSNEELAKRYGISVEQIILRPGIQNFMLKGLKRLAPETYNSALRRELDTKNVDIRGMSDEDLRENFQLRKVGDDLLVAPKSSFGQEILFSALDVIDIAGLIPGRGQVFAAARTPGNLITRQIAEAAGTYLSQQAILQRLGRPKLHRNIALVQFEGELGLETFKVVTSTGRTGLGSYPPHTHAEIVLLSELEKAGIDLTKIKRIFSELEPCIGCERELAKKLPDDIEVEFLFKLDDNGFAPQEWKDYIEELSNLGGKTKDKNKK